MPPFATRAGFAKPTRIRIASVPPGDAPLWVREKWVGVKLNSVLGPSPEVFRSASVVAPPSFFASLWRLITRQSGKVNGYPVQVTAAIDALEKSSPEAATWWRQNTPQLLSPRRFFVFDANACEVMDQ
ncbi:MAG TPA: hypothetical protein VKR31_14550 [Rhizomicrobium sp.]|nr:hypothetical protein [Rhizomicrobium sp.]